MIIISTLDNRYCQRAIISLSCLHDVMKKQCLFIFIFHFINARAQLSWRRRLWHRPRTPSSPSPSPSCRLQRWDTIRARITKFGPEVELDERCSDTKFDVTGYFRSPASGHFVNYFFSNFSVNYLGTTWHKCTKFEQLIVLIIFYTYSKFYGFSSLRSSV